MVTFQLTAQQVGSSGRCTQIQGFHIAVPQLACADEANVPSGSFAVLHEPRTALRCARFGAAEPPRTPRPAQLIESFDFFKPVGPGLAAVARRGWSLLMANPAPRWRERFAISSLRHPSWHGALPAALYDGC